MRPYLALLTDTLLYRVVGLAEISPRLVALALMALLCALATHMPATWLWSPSAWLSMAALLAR